MTPTNTECTASCYAFGQLERRQVVADFSGGQITTDGGLILVAQVDRHYRISERLAACFDDQRNSARVQHGLSELIAQRLYGLVQGYEDLNDHDELRHDPMFVTDDPVHGTQEQGPRRKPGQDGRALTHHGHV